MTKTIQQPLKTLRALEPDAPQFDHLTPTPVGVDVLLDILSYRRSANSAGEIEIISKYLTPLAPREDGFGNMYVVVGKDPTVMFTAHTDTVHYPQRDEPITQALAFYHNNLAVGVRIDRENAANCLGADDGTGMWLLLNLIEAGVPGLYCFFREEETGRNGSEFMAAHFEAILGDLNLGKTPELCLSFDRMGVDSIITHQMGQRGCSQLFVDTLSEQLSADGVTFRADDTGSFTDSYSFMDLVNECTNISVGYYDQHSRHESQDLSFCTWLAKRLIDCQWDKVAGDRDPLSLASGYSLSELLCAFPAECAEILEDWYRLKADELTDDISAYFGIDAEQVSAAVHRRLGPADGDDDDWDVVQQTAYDDYWRRLEGAADAP